MQPTTSHNQGDAFVKVKCLLSQSMYTPFTTQNTKLQTFPVQTQWREIKVETEKHMLKAGKYFSFVLASSTNSDSL